MGGGTNSPPGEGEEESSEPAERLVRRFEESLQEPTESLEAFMMRLRTLATGAFSDEAQRTRTRRVLWRFIAGLWDHDLSERLKERGWLHHQPSGRPVTCAQLVGMARTVLEQRPNIAEGFFRTWPPAALEQYRASVGAQRARVRLGQAEPLPPVPGKAFEGPRGVELPGARQQGVSLGPAPRPPLGGSALQVAQEPSAVRPPPGGGCATRPGLIQPFPSGNVHACQQKGSAQPTPGKSARQRSPDRSGPRDASREYRASKNPGHGGRSGEELSGDNAAEIPISDGPARHRPAASCASAPAHPDAVTPPLQQRGGDSPYETITVVGTSSVSLPLATDADAEQKADVSGAAQASNPGYSAAVSAPTQQQPRVQTPQHQQDQSQQQFQDLVQQQQRRQDPAQQLPSGSGAGSDAMHLRGTAVHVHVNVSGDCVATLDVGSSTILGHVQTCRERRPLRAREVAARAQEGSRSATNGAQSPTVRSRSPIARYDSLQVQGPSPDFQDQQLLVCDLHASQGAPRPVPMDSSLIPGGPSQPQGCRQTAGAYGPVPKCFGPLPLSRDSASLPRHRQSLSHTPEQSPAPRNSASVPRFHDPMDSSPAPGSSRGPVRTNPPGRVQAPLLHVPACPALVHASVPQDLSLVHAPLFHHNPPPPRAPGQRPINEAPASQSDPIPGPRSQSLRPTLFSQYSSLTSVGQDVGLPPLLRYPFSQFAGSAALCVDPTLAARLPAPLSPLSPASQEVMPARLPQTTSSAPHRPSPLAGPPGTHSGPHGSGPAPPRPSPLLQNLGLSLRRGVSGQAPILQGHSVASQEPALPVSRDPSSSAKPPRSPPRRPQGAASRSSSSQGAIPGASAPHDSGPESPDKPRRRLTRSERNRRREGRLARLDKLRTISGNGTERECRTGPALAATDTWNDYRRVKDSD